MNGTVNGRVPGGVTGGVRAGVTGGMTGGVDAGVTGAAREPASGAANGVVARAVQVAVVGPSQASTELVDAAAEVGALLGGAGAVVVVGSALGVSRAAASAAAERGAFVVHLMPQADRVEALARASFVLATGLGETCNALVVCAADAVLAVGGGWGTLSEIALAQRCDVPVVALTGWQVRDATGHAVDGVTVATTPRHAVELVLAAARRRHAALQRAPGV